MIYQAGETVTVVQFDRKAQTYTCTVVNGASWKTTVKASMDDAKKSRETTVRIPEENMPDGLVIAPQDIVCRGKIDGTVNRRADLEGYEHFGVNEVRDNRRGVMLRHWAIIGV